MSTKRMLLTVLAAGAVLLALVCGSQLAGARPPAQAPVPPGATIPYPGRLTDAAGQPVPDGAYDFTFTLYDAETGGTPLWSETQTGVLVQAGAFNVSLGNAQPILLAVLNGGERWLGVAVRGPGESEFTALAPRQWLSAVTMASDRTSAGPACAHDHFGETWSGSGLYGLSVKTTYGNLTGALYGRTDGIGGGVYGEAIGSTSINWGVSGTSNSSVGYGGRFNNTGGGTALYAENDSGGTALFAENDSGGIALRALGNGSGSAKAALRVGNTNSTSGVAAYLTSNSSYPTLEIDKTNPGGAAIDLQLFNPGNYDPAYYIKAYDENTYIKFIVAASGVVGAFGYVDWKADIAEMLPAAKGLEPGDVLAIGPDGNLILSTEPYQTSVAGVYSTDPGFMLGHPLEGKIPGTIPLAMSGVVPVKVSAENGPIRPGDLLVTSATPGHGMRAGPNPPQGTVIGKALEKWDSGTGVIKMLAVLQ